MNAGHHHSNDESTKSTLMNNGMKTTNGTTPPTMMDTMATMDGGMTTPTTGVGNNRLSTMYNNNSGNKINHGKHLPQELLAPRRHKYHNRCLRTHNHSLRHKHKCQLQHSNKEHRYKPSKCHHTLRWFHLTSIHSNKGRRQNFTYMPYDWQISTIAPTTTRS